MTRRHHVVGCTCAGYNWRGPVSSVSATWRVPRLSASTVGLAGTWIGAEGFHDFIQIGVNEGRMPSVTDTQLGMRPAEVPPTFYAFWSDIDHGFHPVALGSVAPGDIVHASMTLEHGRWRLRITDPQSALSVDFSTSEETARTPNVAEWQQEDVEADVTTGQLLPYPRLAPVRFQEMRVNDAPPSDLGLSLWNAPRGSLNWIVGPLQHDGFTVRPAAGYHPPPFPAADPLAIPGARGYSTYTGPHGKPLAVGRPWGKACQPVRLTVEEHVPNWVYGQVATVVKEARSDGIDVALESRQFMWDPASLYYAAGQSPATTARTSR